MPDATAANDPRGGPRGRVRQLRSFVRDYTAGLEGQDLPTLFRRDAAAAYAVLTREHRQDGEKPIEGLRGHLRQARLLFLGLSYKLTPARRLLFAGALAFAAVGLVGGLNLELQTGRFDFYFETGPLFFLLSIGALVFLLALELMDRVRVRDELEVARALQADLLPAEPPEVPGWGFAHAYRTANEVGGDYFDLRQLADGRLAVVIGDASGHGMAAGLLMALAHASLHTALDLDPAPERVAALLNRALCRAGDRRAFMSLFYGLLEPATGRLDYVCAGHPFPLLRRVTGEVEELGCGGLPLGMRPDLAIAPQRTDLAPGDLLLLYTDGLPEGVDAEDHAFGFGRLRSELGPGGPPAALRDRLLGAFDYHRGGQGLRDDLSLVVVHRHRPVPPPPGAGGGVPAELPTSPVTA